MEHITVAGHPEPVPASAAAARMLVERLDAVRETRGQDAADGLEALVGGRIGVLLEGGTPSIDVATMRAIIQFVELPSEDEDEPTGIKGAMQGIRDKLAQRGGPAR